ncbi:MAG: aldehyde ferredoxin oxidoreductase C-terminal domain-containing protein [Planctomycetota bacterium]|nr:aldehyde ferredoxin oxidoreductase C-terminal domain-containing protein [Planctomycetota bacterium]
MRPSTGPLQSAGPPRVLTADLSRAGGTSGEAVGAVAAFTTRDARLARVGAWSGSALAVALFLRALDAGDPPPGLVVAVGEGVRTGLPTAARATVAGIAPLGGRYAEGACGGELAGRLARVADALELRGRSDLPGAVLDIGPDGVGRLVAMPELVGLGPRATARAVESRFGSRGLLCIGPAGERGVAFANLASGEDPPSFVGRGGLGALLGASGLKALVVTADPVDAAGSEGPLIASLRASPRLRARADGGTFELLAVSAARGAPDGSGGDVDAAERLAGELGASNHHRRGCRGCPTPCGWVFERPDGRRQGGRFSALRPLGPALGLGDGEDALALMAACDAVGVDAKEAGACLALEARARELGLRSGPPLAGDADGARRLVEDLAGADVARLGGGARALAEELGLTEVLRLVRGTSAQDETDLTLVLGQCVSARGVDPMRSSPLGGLVGFGGRLRELLAPLPLPPGAEDPANPAGTGRIVWWHENLSAALDMTGFCAFSAAALLADGVWTLDELAGAIAPGALREGDGGARGRALLAAGASLAVLQRELNARLGAGDEEDRPPWAAASLAREGMWDEYRRLRGLDEEGRPTPQAGAAVGEEALLDLHRPPAEPEASLPVQPVAPRAQGRIRLCGLGALARPLAGLEPIECRLPAPLAEVLAVLADLRPGARALLLEGARVLPAVYRDGRPVAAHELVFEGDRLDLVVAIGGG